MYFKWQGHNIYYEVEGSGADLVILNGVMMSAASWQPLLPALTSHFRVICLDFPDQGRSDRLSGAYDQDVMVDVVHELFEVLGLKKAHLLGISYGGEVAMRFALAHPEYINRLILANTTDQTDIHLKTVGEGWIDAASTFDGHKFFRGCMPSIYGKTFYNQHSLWLTEREQQIADGLTQDWYEGFIRLVRSAESYDISAQIHQIEHKTLIIGAEEDLLTPLVCQRRLHDQLPNSAMIILCACGHAAMYEQQELFELAVIGFLRNER